MNARKRKLFPLALDLAGRPVVVAGGGAVAERKVRRLVDCGARVVVVSPAATPGIRDLARDGAIEWHARGAEEADLAGQALAFLATNDAELNGRLARAARMAKIPANVATDAGACDFVVPATLSRGDVEVAVFTASGSAALSKWIARSLGRVLDSEIAPFSELFAQIRGEVGGTIAAQEERAAALNRVLESDVLDVLKRDGYDAALSRARIVVREGADAPLHDTKDGGEPQ